VVHAHFKSVNIQPLIFQSYDLFGQLLTVSHWMIWISKMYSYSSKNKFERRESELFFSGIR